MTTFIDGRLIFDDDTCVERIQERRYKVALTTSLTIEFTDGDCVQFTNDEGAEFTGEDGTVTGACSVWG